MGRGFLIILLYLGLGTFISMVFSIPVPGSVIGMLLLFLSLLLGIIKDEHIKPAADFLISHMSLFFIPAGIGLMVYGKEILREFTPIVVSVVISTFVVLAVTGFIAQKMEKGE